MTQIIFEGDWSAAEAESIASHLKPLLSPQPQLPELEKSVGIGDGESVPADLNPPQITDDFPALFSKRQRKLLEMLRTASSKALEKSEDNSEEDTPLPWTVYAPSADLKPLGKGLFAGQMKTTSDGTYRLNENRRWERIENTGVGYSVPTGQFKFDRVNGPYGLGVYFPVLSEPTGGIRIRIRLNLTPDQLISEEQFEEIEEDLSQDTDFLLDGKGVEAVARSTANKVTLLCIRNPDKIIPLGIIANSGTVPSGTPAFNLAEITPNDDHWIAEIEMVSADEPLNKSARTSRAASFQSKSYLNGTPLVRSHLPQIDRQLLRRAIDRCKLDGVDLSEVRINLVSGKPDFLHSMVRFFCLPSDGVINVCPHDPQAAIGSLCSELSNRLKVATATGAMPADTALDILSKAAQMNAEWYLEMWIKHYIGAILCDRRWNSMNGGEPPAQYMAMLVGRGVSVWGNRRSVLQCMAEDYRVAHDQNGLPNQITMEWDAAVPSLARASQQLLLNLLGENNAEAN